MALLLFYLGGFCSFFILQVLLKELLISENEYAFHTGSILYTVQLENVRLFSLETTFELLIYSSNQSISCQFILLSLKIVGCFHIQYKVTKFTWFLINKQSKIYKNLRFTLINFELQIRV